MLESTGHSQDEDIINQDNLKKHVFSHANSLAENFRMTDDIAEKLSLVEQAEESGTTFSLANAGDMWLDLAWHHPEDPYFQTNAMSNALLDWQRAITNRGFVSKYHDDASAHASIRIASTPLYGSLIFKGEIAKQDKLEEVYNQMTGVSSSILSSIIHHQAIVNISHSEQDITSTRELCGSLLEAEVLMLLHRFSLNNNLDNWSAVPSLLSENRAYIGAIMELNPSWDLSVFTKPKANDPAEIPYKIQVKSHDEIEQGIDNSKYMYAEDIIVVRARQDLRIGGASNDRLLNIGTITNEINRERDGDSKVSKILDKREGKLLDLLG